ncbi:MAG: glutathione S-transferase family protein [Proteobacteria bacterium]|nr:glutathione S-transferase family protein [Pseudomonadota bacterium]
MIRLYDFITSGNCWKVRLVLSHLGRPYERVEIDRFTSYTRSAEYRAINPLGLVPALRLEDGRILHDSAAIAFYLTEDTSLLPADAPGRAEVIQWLIYEQRYICETVGMARYIVTTLGKGGLDEAGAQSETLAEVQRLGHEGLAGLETRLAKRDFLIGAGCTIADLCNYVYVAMADQGNMDLAPYPAIRRWLARLEALPGHRAMGDVPAPVLRRP